MRLLISGGGTGGHIYPALAILRKLMTENSMEVLFMGSRSGMEAQIIPHEGLPFRGVTTASLRGSSLWRIPLQLMAVAKGVVEAWGIISRFRPQAILATGGYVCAPAVMAGWLCRVPSLVYLPDIEPGLAVRLLVRFARCVAVSFPPSKAYLPSAKVIVTGYPVREGLFTTDKDPARKALGLPFDKPVLLVFGGSRGAHSINLAVERALPNLLELCQLAHISGYEDFEWLDGAKEALPKLLKERYHLYPYLHEEIVWVMKAADLAISRAGASTLGELPAAGLPSILVPYPYAARHQERNADYLVAAGAAVKIRDEALDKELLPTVERLLGDTEELARMARAAKDLATPEAAKAIAKLLKEIALQNV